MMVMLAHGFNTGGLFLCVGIIYERAHTRNITAFGGLASRDAEVVGLLHASSCSPASACRECPASSANSWWPWAPGTTTAGPPLFTFSVVIFAAWYMLWLFQRVVFGRASGQAPDPGDSELLPSEVEELARRLGGGHGRHDDHWLHGALHPLPSAAATMGTTMTTHGAPEQLPDARGPDGQLAAGRTSPCKNTPPCSRWPC